MAIQLPVRPSIRPPRYAHVREPGRRLIGLGAATALLGVAALVMAEAATVMTVIALGVFAVIAAVFQWSFAFTAGKWEGFGLHLLLAVLYGIVGIYLIINPVAGAASVTLALGFLFVISGVFRLVASTATRFANWGWSFLSGLVTTLLGLFVLEALPSVGLILLGTLLGVDLLLYGINLTVLGIGLRRVERGLI